jgi:hypothetical protein
MVGYLRLSVDSCTCHPGQVERRTLDETGKVTGIVGGAHVREMPKLLTTVAAPAAGQTISGTRRCATANSKSHSSSTSARAS